MNLSVAQLFSEAAKKMRSDFEYIRSTNPHAGEKGKEAENVVCDFLNHHLPQRFRATSGIIIDKDNALSPQTDVIVYDALTSPVYRYTENMLILPLDMVAAVIEVKSRLNKKELEDGYEKVAACKRLRKAPLSQGDQQATGSELRSVATYGVVFGFSSDTSLATLAQHTEELNRKYEPEVWPDLLVLLDSGTISYGVQFPGASSMGHMMPPTDKHFAIPPMNIYLLLKEDGDFTLNRFFLILLSHLTFFPRRIGTPSFDQILAGAAKKATTLQGYQYNRNRKLTVIPDTLYKDQANLVPLTISFTANDGTLRGVLRYFPWIEGDGVLAWSGAMPLAPLLLPLGNIGLTMMTRHGDVEYSNPLTLSQTTFREWPEKLNKSFTNMSAQISGFVLKRVVNERTTEPFIARLLAGMFELRERAFGNGQERQNFDAAYGPVIENLIEARRIYRGSIGMQDALGSEAVEFQSVSFDTSIENALRAVSLVFQFFGLPSGAFLLAPDAAFTEGVASLYAHDPLLATYLLACRANWLGDWTGTPGEQSLKRKIDDSSKTEALTLENISAFVENVCVHLLSRSLAKSAKSLVLIEIPLQKRDPNNPKRFEVTLARDGAVPWILEYGPTEFTA